MSGLQSFYSRDVGHTQYLAYGADDNFVDISRTGTISTASGSNAGQSVSLGFTYNYYGRAVSSVYITTEGQINLTTSLDYTPRALPSTAEPYGLIGPFWGNLYNTNSGSQRIRYQTIGTAPNRTFVVEWQNSRSASYADQWLTFEILMHEADYTMEFVYGGMLRGQATSSARRLFASGSTAGIAIQNYDRNAGHNVGLNNEGTTLSGSWFVFNPIMPGVGGTYAGYATWSQNATMTDATQDAAMVAACSAAYPGSRPATAAEFGTPGSIAGLPATNTSGYWLIGVCPGCIGIACGSCASGHARNCVDPNAVWPATYDPWAGNTNCYNSTRSTVCVR